MKNFDSVEIGLNAAIVAMIDNNPGILRIASPSSKLDALPYGPFSPVKHRTMELGLRKWVKEQTSLKLGYVEQLYTFGDRGRYSQPDENLPHVVSVGYLALTRQMQDQQEKFAKSGADWRDIYQYLPWEDWRSGRPAILDEVILPELEKWVEENDTLDFAGMKARDERNTRRIQVAFGISDIPWDEERVLERYELIYSAGLVQEAVNDQRIKQVRSANPLGASMVNDHRRILATALSRLRAKLKYRPVIFELMASEFTLLELQQAAESIMGRKVHKQNFRRLVESNKLVEPVGKTSTSTGGRPAALFRFRREVIAERPSPGLRLGRA